MRRRWYRVALIFAALSVGPFVRAPAHAESPTAEWVGFRSAYFEKPIVRLAGVFVPSEAETVVLPFMTDFADLFEGRTVLEIGCGSGIVSAYAAQLGATRVVATDIDERAVRSAEANAQRLGFAAVIDPRLVPTDDTTAFSVVGDDEKFDIIISNPPYALDLDARRYTPATDTGDLGLSIIRGFDDHLEPNGMAMLYYGSLFYHGVMVKLARAQGYEVRNNQARVITSWEAQTLFNGYLSRFLEYQGLEPKTIRFSQKELERIQIRAASYPELIPGHVTTRPHPGWMIIRRADEVSESEP